MASPESKKCTKCGIEKSLEYFEPRKRNLSGRDSRCAACIKDHQKEYRRANPEIYRKSALQWSEKNREKRLLYFKNWAKDNPDKRREASRKSSAKYLTNPKCRLSKNISRRIRKDIGTNKRGLHWEKFVGFTFRELQKHLEKQFKPEMTWDNYGTTWHIDHKIPVAAFNFRTYGDIDFKRCWSLDNLQPMFTFDNLSKNDHLKKPFQPSFAITV